MINEIAIVKEAFLEIEKMQKHTPYLDFLQSFTHITGRMCLPATESREAFYSVPEFTYSQKIDAIQNAMRDSWHKDGKLVEVKNFITPEFILKKENLTKYHQFTPSQKIQKEEGAVKQINNEEFTKPMEI